MFYFYAKNKLALVAITQTLTRSDLKTIINQGSFAVGLTKLIKNPEAISSNVGFFNKGHGKSQKARPLSDHMNSETCETLWCNIKEKWRIFLLYKYIKKLVS